MNREEPPMSIDGRTPADPDPSETSVDMWRDEIEAFGRETTSQLQSILANLEALQRASRRANASPSATNIAMPTATRQASPPTDGSLRANTPDNSEDRLANLKKMLAAKLSQSAAETVIDE